MRACILSNLLHKLIIMIFMLCFASIVYAKDDTAEQKTIKASAQTSSSAPTDKTNKKMVQEATINLQTTVTGNQEQPRVLYILPWQSPAPEDVDFEAFDNQQKAVFRHIEREELRRELESANE